MNYKKKSIKIYILIILLSAFLIYLIYGFYKPLSITEYTISSAKLPDGFDGFRIVQLSDFHCASFGGNGQELVDAIRAQKPDLIVFTGDMIDTTHSFQNIETLVEGVNGIAPVYSVIGNHEYDDWPQYIDLTRLYKQYGITMLDGSYAEISRGGESIFLFGPDDKAPAAEEFALSCDLTYYNPDNYNILLYHYGNYFDQFKNIGFDLALTGHTHGGIVRLPFIGGLISPDGSLFPSYDAGLYEYGRTKLIISRGLGESHFPRFYNHPELVSVTLRTEK